MQKTAHLVSGLFHQTSFSKVFWVLDPFMSCSALVFGVCPCFQGVKFCYFVKPAGVFKIYWMCFFCCCWICAATITAHSVRSPWYYFSKQSFIQYEELMWLNTSESKIPSYCKPNQRTRRIKAKQSTKTGHQDGFLVDRLLVYAATEWTVSFCHQTSYLCANIWQIQKTRWLEKVQRFKWAAQVNTTGQCLQQVQALKIKLQ